MKLKRLLRNSKVSLHFDTRCRNGLSWNIANRLAAAVLGNPRRSILVAAVVCLLTSQVTADAKDRLSTSVSWTLGIGSGQTEYIISGRGIDTSGNDVWVKSELEFPLSCTLFGVSARIHSKSMPRPWSLELTLLTNLSHPSEKMRDHDWIDIENGFSGKLAFTTSDAEMMSLVIGLRAKRYLWGFGSLQMGPMAAFRHQWISQDIIGAHGWVVDYRRPPYPEASIGTSDKVIDYRISYYLPMLGVTARIDAGEHLTGEMDVAATAAIYSDFDDHLLRHKTANSSGIGPGLIANVDVGVALGKADKRVTPIVGIVGRLLTLHATGSQSQDWYGDDPLTEDRDDTGARQTGISHEVNCTQYLLALRIGLVF